MRALQETTALQVLLSAAIDYAGLFPPAGQDMARAIVDYAEARRGEHAWMLGRFVLPARRLVEFDRTVARSLPAGFTADPWRLTVIAGPRLEEDVDRIVAFGLSNAGRAVVESVEVAVSTPQQVERAVRLIPAPLAVYLEIPIREDPVALVAAIAAGGERAKIRTGGTFPEAIPSSAHLVRFLARCAAAGVPFKATGGLHHPLPGVHRLTASPDSPAAPMHGFVNLLVAAAMLGHGVDQDEARRLLDDDAAAAFRMDDEGISWRGHRVDVARLAAARQSVALGFGSCSFRDPVADLSSLGLL